MSQTRIEWATTVWNPVTGCTPVSEGCRNCYAARFARRLAGRCGYPEDEPFRVTLHPERLREPLKWKKPRRVFVCSMGDLFHELVEEKFIAKIFAIMDLTKKHTYCLLTKRPERAFQLLSSEDFQFYIGWFQSQAVREFKLPEPENTEQWQWPFSNVWIGVTAENQEMADRRIPVLLQIPAAVRFVSCEPLLGPINLREVKVGSNGYGLFFKVDTLTGWAHGYNEKTGHIKVSRNDEFGRIHWVICGGESGPNARPCHLDWVRSLRDQCQAAEVAFFFKSWGEHGPAYGHGKLAGIENVMVKMGKKKAGRLLGGRMWDEVPGVTL